MSSLQVVILVSSILLECGLLVALGLRIRSVRCLALSAYVLAVMLSKLALLARPDVLLDRGIWAAVEGVHLVLRYGVALELSYYAFRAFPAARRRMRGFLRLVTAVSLLSPFLAPRDLISAEGWIVGVLPRVNYASIWLFTGLGLLVLWYRLPMHRMHKAAIMGLAPYLLVFGLASNLLARYGLEHQAAKDYLSYLNTLAYTTLMGYWNWVAWRLGPLRRAKSASDSVATPPAA